MDNELLMRAMIADREREVSDMTPSRAVGQRRAFRATVAGALARLALSIEPDTARRATARAPVDFRVPHPS